MGSHSIKKSVLFILMVCIAFSVVFTIVMTAALLDHKCRVVNCPICEIIKAAKCFFKTLKLLAPLIFLAFGIIHLFETCSINSIYCINPLSQIVLKVRFNT